MYFCPLWCAILAVGGVVGILSHMDTTTRPIQSFHSGEEAQPVVVVPILTEGRDALVAVRHHLHLHLVTELIILLSAVLCRHLSLRCNKVGDGVWLIRCITRSASARLSA